jgi:hypothetical protein
MPATPQDHKPKADAPFTFKVGGKSYKLPKVSESEAMTIPGEITYDAIMQPDSEMAQMRLAFATLEACKPTPAAMSALKSLPTDKMLETLGDWMGGLSASSD